MVLKYEIYDYTPVLGWSVSRYETFDTCKRRYFYTYYSKYAENVSLYKIKQLKAMTSTALEIGNVVHDIIEAFLLRLQKSDTSIDEDRFFTYARSKAEKYFSTKTFLEIYYGHTEKISLPFVFEKIDTCLKNFLQSPICSWIYMKALTNKTNWMIEPPGYGETRLDGLKAYCKMDFLFPVDGDIYILDWKTGQKDTAKHSSQLIGYAAAAASNFHIPWNTIYPKIVYLYPQFEEFELALTDKDLHDFFAAVRRQTQEMKAYCRESDRNTPLPIDNFPLSPSPSLCSYCNFQELCFPDRKPVKKTPGIDNPGDT
ncbi:MAG: hypothetical protein GF350_09910 [Chitinivibrionales bacterium]|nr:hypothetical protein [Chitinivibrionales bacterium]